MGVGVGLEVVVDGSKGAGGRGIAVAVAVSVVRVVARAVARVVAKVVARVLVGGSSFLTNFN